MTMTALYDLGENAERDLTRHHAAEVEAGGCFDAREALVRHPDSARVVEEEARFLSARDEADVGGAGGRRCDKRVLVPHPHCRDDDRICLVRRGNAHMADRTGQIEERTRDGRVAEHTETGRRQHRLDIDLHASLPLAGHRISAYVARRVGTRLAGIHAHEPWSTSGQGLARFSDYDRADAPATNPALDRSVRKDNGLRPSTHRLRRIARDHGRQDEWRARTAKLSDAIEDFTHPEHLFPNPFLSQDAPHFEWRDGNVDVPNAKMPQRVDDRVGDSRRRADRRTLGDALCA